MTRNRKAVWIVIAAAAIMAAVFFLAYAPAGGAKASTEAQYLSLMGE